MVKTWGKLPNYFKLGCPMFSSVYTIFHKFQSLCDANKYWIEQLDTRPSEFSVEQSKQLEACQNRRHKLKKIKLIKMHMIKAFNTWQEWELIVVASPFTIHINKVTETGIKCNIKIFYNCTNCYQFITSWITHSLLRKKNLKT